MRFIKAAIIGMFLGTLVSCALMPFWGQRMTPHYTKVDPRALSVVNEWLSLAKQHGLKFSQTVNVGFTNIGKENIIGQCNYGLGFNEIDIDFIYWTYVDNTITNQTLMLHELTHCYCDRSHDYGKNLNYTTDDSNDKNGFLEDGCPKSIMFPYVLDNNCFLTHYAYYVDEMFERCDPI